MPNKSPFQSRMEVFGEMMTRSDFRTAVERLTTLLRDGFVRLEDRLVQRVDAKLATVKDGAPGPKGDTGAMGKTGPQGKAIQGPVGPQGAPAPAVDEAALAERIVGMTVPRALEILQSNMPVLATEIRNALELLRESERIGTGTIDGLEQYIVDLVKKHTPYVEMGGAAVSIAHLGVVKAQTANAINFKGAGAPTTTLDAQGIVQLDFAASGAGEVVLTATETPNGATTVFTFAAASAQPTYVYADNTRLRATSAAGTVNWTWNNATKKATLTIAPQDEIYATA